MGQPESSMPKSPTSHLHAMNLVVALLAGVISITGGIYSLKNNLFSGPAYGSVQGVVRDERIARPLKLAVVEISDLTGAVVNTAETDDNGHYLLEALKAGNYVVKFTAPMHKIETKTIKIEKDLASSINVDLVPEASRADLTPAEYAAPVQRNIPAPYAPATTYQTSAPAAPSYNASGTMSPGSNVPQTYSQTEPPVQDPSRTGYRRHSRYSYPQGPVGSPSGTSQTTSQSSVLAQAGTQLLQAWLAKKSENGTTTAATTTN